MLCKKHLKKTKKTVSNSHSLQQTIERHRFISIPSNRKYLPEYRQGNQVVSSGIQFTDIEESAKEHYSVIGSHC